MIRKYKRAGNTGKTKRSRRSLIGTLLIVAGVSLALFPFLTNIYNQHFLAAPVGEEILELLEGELPEEQEILEEQEENPALILPEKEPEPVEYPEALLPKEGALRIPAIGLLTGVVYGVEPNDLKKSPGFYPQSGYPDTGNVAIAGHRTTYGAWFRNLDKLEPGDEIRLYYQDTIYIYAVDSVFDIHNRDWSVIDPTDKPALTLTTCHPPRVSHPPPGGPGLPGDKSRV